MRRLSLISVQSVLQSKLQTTVEPGNNPDHQKKHYYVRFDDNLRHTLSQLLESGNEGIPVVDSSGQKIGKISLNDLRSTIIENTKNYEEQKQNELPG
jgi:predicted transcriptional regulator